MRFKSCLRVVLAAALLTLPAVKPALAAGPAGTGAISHMIKMKAAEIDTSGGNLSIFSEGKLSPGSHFYIVQFSGPVQESWKQRISDMGVKFFGYLPDDAFIVKMDASTASGVSADPAVTWVGPYRPEFRLAPRGHGLGAVKEGAAPETGAKEYTVKVFDGEDMHPVIDRLDALGATVEVVADKDGLNGKLLRARMDDSLAQEAAKMDEVEWVEEFTAPRLLNDVATGIMDVSPVWTEPFPGLAGLTGTGQVVGIMDTGLDTGNVSAIHPAFAGTVNDENGNPVPKIKDAFGYTATYAKNGSWSDSEGHGTHTCGSLTGKPFMGISGAAFDAQLVFQGVYEASNGNLYVPDLNTQVFPDAYNDGVRVHSNSWGGGKHGDYDSFCVSADTFIWNHPDFVACFAAGNDGEDANGDGVIDPGSVISPGTAKDVICVGAAESYRPDIPGTWDQIFSFNPWLSAPFNSDWVADNKNGMAAFSSRGPAGDGRIKPDVVAPGTMVVSTMSTYAYTSSTNPYAPSPYAYSGFSSAYNQYFTIMSGTSMATPLAAGAAALLRQYFTDVQRVTPSAALIKAALISGAYNMAPGQYGTGKYQEIHNPPDKSQGWGRVDLENSITPPAPAKVLFTDYTSGVSTGQTLSYFYNVTDATVPVKATLVWSDYPGAPEASNELVNDLDLSTTGPDGRIYYGNKFDTTGFSTPFTAPDAAQHDRTNNVEVVEINPAASGTIEIDVNGYNVPDGPQPFALVVDGGVESQVSCDFSLTSSSAQFPYNGGAGSFGVNSGGTCSWTPVSDSPWITITSPGTFSGSGPVGYSVAPNPTLAARTGRVLAGGQTFQVIQDAAPVNFSMLPVRQEGRTVTLQAAFSLGDTPIVNKPVTFYDQNVKKGTARTDGGGIAAIRFKAAIGAHSSYAASPTITVRAATIQAQNTDATPLNFTIARVIPASPIPPADGAVVTISPVSVVTVSPVTLSWSLYPGATGYEAQVCSNRNFSPPRAVQGYSASAGSCTLPAYSPGTAKFWRVRAVLPTGHSLYSAVSKFKYKPAPVLGLSSSPYSAAKVTLTATVTDGSGNGIGGRKVYFYDDGAPRGYALTKADGTAVKRVAASSGSTVQAEFKGDGKYSAAAPVSTTIP
jgi:Subtilase family